MSEEAPPPSVTNTNDMTDLAIVAKVGKRSNDNITDIKNNLKTLEGTLIKLSTSRDSLIDAIVRDAAESINYWQEVVKKRKSELKIVLQSFMIAVSAQEKTIASLDIINKKYDTERKALAAAATRGDYRKWPAMWGGKTPRQSFTGDTVNVDTSWGKMPSLPTDYGSGTGQTTGTPYTEAELRNSAVGFLKSAT